MAICRNDACPCGSGIKYKLCCLKSGGVNAKGGIPLWLHITLTYFFLFLGPAFLFALCCFYIGFGEAAVVTFFGSLVVSQTLLSFVIPAKCKGCGNKVYPIGIRKRLYKCSACGEQNSFEIRKNHDANY